MSIIGFISLLTVIGKIFDKKNPAVWTIFTLLIFLLQTIFVFIDGYCIRCILAGTYDFNNLLMVIYSAAVISGAVILYKIVSSKNIKQRRIIIVVTMIICILYTEFFNGILTFNSKQDFFAYQLSLKKYYFLAPFKLQAIDPSVEHYRGQDVDVYLFLYKQMVKLENGKLKYYRTNGFGENGDWFEFGVPEGQQV
ncbi:hypothetical protein [Paenibacillus harenae]|uniref:hypothetical protein n=1 Tax=Paenibacillus harenae TaxID=306543 RepID=UPI002793E69C|nr:hypothetical protein [Paenibacillus harenae]MDQ0062753.1 putative integral membrane protein [Paenibacillus harenae]